MLLAFAVESNHGVEVGSFAVFANGFLMFLDARKIRGRNWFR